MRFTFNNIFEPYEVTFEIYIGDTLAKTQTMQAPKEMLMASFMQTVNQIARDQRPMKIRMSRPEIIWDEFEKREKVLTNEVVFGNNAMIAWEEEKQKGENK